MCVGLNRYKPVNTAYDLKYPGRWQPQSQLINVGIYKARTLLILIVPV
jgi:hypothetical protein